MSGAGADAFQQRDTAPGSPFVLVVTKPSRSGRYFTTIALLALKPPVATTMLLVCTNDLFFVVDQTYTANLIPAHQDLFHRGIQQDVNTAFGDVAHRAANQIAADR